MLANARRGANVGVVNSPTDHGSVDRDALAARAFALCVACPLKQDNPHDCPLNDIRRLSLVERLEWVKHSTDRELEELCKHHCSCLAEKERALLPHPPSTSVEPPPRKNS